MSNFMNSGLSAGMGGPMSLEEYQNFLRGQSQGAMGSAQRAMESFALPPNDNLGFIGRRLSNYMQRDNLRTVPSAPAPMPDNVAAMSGVPTGATDTSSMTREEIAALPQVRDIASEMMANRTGPSMNNPMGFSPNLGGVGRGIMGVKGGAD